MEQILGKEIEWKPGETGKVASASSSGVAAKQTPTGVLPQIRNENLIRLQNSDI